MAQVGCVLEIMMNVETGNLGAKKDGNSFCPSLAVASEGYGIGACNITPRTHMNIEKIGPATELSVT